MLGRPRLSIYMSSLAAQTTGNETIKFPGVLFVAMASLLETLQDEMRRENFRKKLEDKINSDLRAKGVTFNRCPERKENLLKTTLTTNYLDLGLDETAAFDKIQEAFTRNEIFRNLESVASQQVTVGIDWKSEKQQFIFVAWYYASHAERIIKDFYFEFWQEEEQHMTITGFSSLTKPNLGTNPIPNEQARVDALVTMFERLERIQDYRVSHRTPEEIRAQGSIIRLRGVMGVISRSDGAGITLQEVMKLVEENLTTV